MGAGGRGGCQALVVAQSVLPLRGAGRIGRKARDIHAMLVGTFDAPMNSDPNKVTPGEMTQVALALALASEGKLIIDPDGIKAGRIDLTTPAVAESSIVAADVARQRLKAETSAGKRSTLVAMTDAADLQAQMFEAAGFDLNKVRAKARAAGRDAAIAAAE
jgi:hypothetical protein